MGFLQRLFSRKQEQPQQRPDEVSEALRKEFYAQFLRDDDLVFDIGANVGNRIRPFLSLGARVVAVEPQEECVKILKKNFGSSISLVKKGIGSESGVRDFFISDANTISSFSQEWIAAVKESGRFANHKWEKTVQIDMITLDDLIKEYGNPKFVKIDVEGYESEVLKGLTHPVEYISFEYTVPEQSLRCLECLDLVRIISANALFNYSIGERMELALPEWISVGEMTALVRSKEFSETQFGDVYVKMVI